MDLPFSSFTSPADAEVYSGMYLKQTPRKFFETIDKLSEGLGISPEDIRKLKELRSEAGSDDLGIQYFEQLQELIAPVFFRLREMGYGYLELTM